MKDDKRRRGENPNSEAISGKAITHMAQYKVVLQFDDVEAGSPNAAADMIVLQLIDSMAHVVVDVTDEHMNTTQETIQLVEES